jgi:hypothetical protein
VQCALGRILWQGLPALEERLAGERSGVKIHAHGRRMSARLILICGAASGETTSSGAERTHLT